MNSTATLPLPDPAVLFRPVSEGAVLLHVEDEVYFGLNEVGCRIWELLPPESSDLSELVSALAAVYPEVSEATLREDVTELLLQLQDAGLVRTA
jgi:hypothetical protein